MAGVAGVDTSLKTFLDCWKANKSAKLTLESVNGALSVTMKMSIGQWTPEACRGHQSLQRRQAGPSQLRRRERRSADKAVQQRAAEHAASAAVLTASALSAAVQAVSAPAEQADDGGQASAAGQAAAALVPAAQAATQGEEASPPAEEAALPVNPSPSQSHHPTPSSDFLPPMNTTLKPTFLPVVDPPPPLPKLPMTFPTPPPSLPVKPKIPATFSPPCWPKCQLSPALQAEATWTVTPTVKWSVPYVTSLFSHG